jgi:hypothetical protein
VVYVYRREFHTDADNLTARLKGVIDCLVQAGVLQGGDASDVLSLGVSYRVDLGVRWPSLELTLTPAEATDQACTARGREA